MSGKYHTFTIAAFRPAQYSKVWNIVSKGSRARIEGEGTKVQCKINTLIKKASIKRLQ